MTFAWASRTRKERTTGVQSRRVVVMGIQSAGCWRLESRACHFSLGEVVELGA